jgi:hypothetical protein
MRTEMSVEQGNAVTATTQSVLTHHLNSFGDIAGTRCRDAWIRDIGVMPALD